jgi:hypothetical protein
LERQRFNDILSFGDKAPSATNILTFVSSARDAIAGLGIDLKLLSVQAQTAMLATFNFLRNTPYDLQSFLPNLVEISVADHGGRCQTASGKSRKTVSQLSSQISINHLARVSSP